VIGTSGGYLLDASRVDVDADRFEQAATAGLSLAGSDEATAASHLERALDLYRGEFLADEPYAEWAFAERDRLRELATRSLSVLSGLRLAAGDAESATSLLRRLAEIEPFDMRAQRRLLALMLDQDRYSEAQRLYTALRARMRDVFGEAPDFDLASLSSSSGRRD
jgi:DNA-binding SARP family transcriptional activator